MLRLVLVLMPKLENNRICFQGVTDQIRRKGEVVSDILDFLIQYKIECVRRAEPTPIMDR